jgi:capsular exopolysaccharide synthesis family protein
VLPPRRSREEVAGDILPAKDLRLRLAASVRRGDPAPIIGLLGGSSPISEELRILKAKLGVIGEQRPLKCVGMVSAAGGEGKTTVAIGLSIILAQEADRRVLLIEADVRRPAVEGYLGLMSMEGLGDYLQGPGDELVVRRLEPHGFYLLSAGRPPAPPPELLGGPRMRQLLDSIRDSFDYVVVDCPPLGPVADSVLLQDLVDGFVFVVRARHSPVETIAKAVSHLRADRIVGVVLNDNREILTSYYSYGYRKYHDRY